MKKIFLTALILINFCCKAQQYDTVSQTELTMNGVNFLINSGTNDVSLIINTFGQPDSNEDYFFETDNVMGKKYSYNNGLVLYIANNSLESFEITGNSYSFTAKNVRIGDNISSFQTKFPLTYNSKANLKARLNYSNWDAGFLIEYLSSGVITKILFYTP